MCASVADIQTAIAEIKREKKKIDGRKKPQGKNIMSATPHLLIGVANKN